MSQKDFADSYDPEYPEHTEQELEDYHDDPDSYET